MQGFNPAAHTLFIADTGANVSAHISALIGHGFPQIQVASGTLSATAAQLLDPSIHFLSGAHAQLASSVTLNASAAAILAALPGISDAPGVVLTVADSAANLASNSAAWQAAAGAVVLAADAIVTASTAVALSQLATSFGNRFSLSGHNLTVSDTLAALVGLPTQAATLASAVLLSTDATATAAQLIAFQALPHSGFAGHTVAVADTAGNLLSISGASLSHVSSVSLTGDAVVSVAQAMALAAEPNFSAGGHAFIIADTAANLLTLSSNILHLANAVELSADATLSAASAQALTSEAGYTADAHLLTIDDSAAVLSNLTAPVVAFAANEQVNVSATISAATAAALASLPHLTEAAGVTLTVQDSMSNLLAAPEAALSVAGAVRLVPGSMLVTDAAHAASLAAISGFSSAGSTIAVVDSVAHLNAVSTAGWSSIAAMHAIVDSADALVGAAGSPLLTSATSVGLTSPVIVTAATAATLASLSNFTSAGQLSVVDTTGAILARTSSLVALGRPVTLTDSATINTAQVASLAQVAAASGPGFSLGQQSLTIADTAADLLSLTPAQAALAGAMVLTANATLTASQFAALRSLPHVSTGGQVIKVSDTAADLANLNGNMSLLGAADLSGDASVTVGRFALLTALPSFSVAGHALTITDTAANLLGASSLNLSQATSIVLSADATVNGQQAQVLTAEPGFSTGGHQLTIADTAQNLLALPHSILLSANSLALSNSENVSATVLNQLAGLGIKFTEAGNILTCVDTASNLSDLSPAALALAHAEVLSTSSVVTAAAASALANLPAFSLATGVSLTVQDSVANLIALGQAAPANVTAETLAAGSVVTVNAQQAVSLASLPHFMPGSASITVADTITNLTAAGSTVLQAIAQTVDVSDTAANLAANAMSSVVRTAGSVSLSGNAVVTAFMAAQIASIPHFTAGNYQLEVVDTAANIAQQAVAISDAATGTIVTDSGPISATMADQLALLSAAHTLSFQSGNQLLVQDNYAALTNPANSTGLALASRIGVVDTPANLITASSHDWGGLNPSYTLSQDGVVTASTAASLAALGSHFSTAGHQLSVADTAAAVVGAAQVLTSLHLTASVTDSAADLSAQAANLINLGSMLAHVTVSDTTPVSAALATSLSGLASLLTGPALQVAGDAADVQASISGLMLLTDHVAATVLDSAVDVATYASTLASLGSHLTIVLTDSTPVTAATVSALAPVVAQLAPVQLAISDNGAAIAAHATTLASNGPMIGTITLSDGNTQTAANVAALACLDGHLGAGVRLTATGTAAEVASNENGLTALNNDGRLASVLVLNTTVSDAVTYTAALNALPASVSISDNAADVDAGLSNLGQIGGLQAITLTDGTTPVLSMTIASLASDGATLTKITSPFSIAIVDTAAQISADLALGTTSEIISHLNQIGQLQASDGSSIVLDQAQILASNVDDGLGSALALFTGTVQVTGVDVAHLAQIAALTHTPASIAIVDTSAEIAQDLAQGSSSAILGSLGLLTQIRTAPGGIISLNAAQALYAGVDDGPQSAFGLMPSTNLAVTGASVADIPQLTQLYSVPTTISVSDTAANLSADLTAGNSLLVADLPKITTISVLDGMTISLTEQQVFSAGIDDSANSALTKIINLHLNVSQVTAADIATVLGLEAAPTTIEITDTGAHIVSSLNNLLSDIGVVTSVDVTGGALVLSADEALQTHVDDGSGSLIDRVLGHAFDVVGATVAQLPALASLSDAPTTISVTDGSSNVVADLVSGQSALAAVTASLDTINVTQGTLTLTDTQADFVVGNPSLDAALSHLATGTVVAVTEVPVSDLAAIASSCWSHIAIAVADNATNIAIDLTSANSVLQANVANTSSVTLTAGGVVDAATLTAMADLPQFHAAGYSLTVHDNAAAILGLSSTALQLSPVIQVADTSSMFQGSLDALQGAFSGRLTITLTDATPDLVITPAQYINDRATIDAVTNPGAFTVSGSAASLAAIAGNLASDPAIGTVAVTDNAFNVISDFSSLSLAGSKLHVSLSDTSITANLVPPLLNIASLGSAGLTVVDTGSQIAALIESGTPGAIAYLNTYGASLSSDSAVTAMDASALESLGTLSKAGHTLVVWDTAQHLTMPAFTGTLSNTAIDSVHLRTSAGVAIVTATQAATLFSIPGFSTSNPSGTTNTLSVEDTVAHIDAEHAALSANANQISSVVVSSNASVSDQVLNDLQSLGATPAAGVTLSVKDTAANIAANAASQITGHSISPTSWMLSGNGTVNEAGALALATLPQFTTGPFTITVGLNANTSISIADANRLGTLAGAISLGGYQFQVAGSVAQLSALSSGALQVVTPMLADSAISIAALPSNSPLLLGGVEVTGNDTLNAATATALLNLVHTGSGTGIAATALTFDTTHNVSDTVANLRTLISSMGWTGNPTTHANFHLVAQDSAENLVNPNSFAFLSGLTSTTLLGDTTISVATANALASSAAAIHFDRGSFHITVQGSVADLINPADVNGIGFADSVQLNGPGQTNAADAEALLAISHLNLNTTLTISDSSNNLLDGTLGNAITNSGFASHVVVQLACPETLDAQTAESLVNVAGFADTHDMTIADDPSYLLNGANLTAEQMAVQVTLAGDETVSANTVLRLSQIPHFAPGDSHLILATDDFADAPTLKAIADMGSAFDANGHTLTMTSDVLNLTPAEFAALQQDNLSQNGHLLGVVPTNVAVTDLNSVLHMAGTGVSGGTTNVYAADGSLVSSTLQTSANISVGVADADQGHNFSITESAGGMASQGAPIVLLDSGVVEGTVAASGSNFASSGEIKVTAGKFVNIYEAGSVPFSLAHPALVYDPAAHTIALDVPGQASTTLITLGGSEHPAGLDASEILFKLHG